jgi:hypothetical protein
LLLSDSIDNVVLGSDCILSRCNAALPSLLFLFNPKSSHEQRALELDDIVEEKFSPEGEIEIISLHCHAVVMLGDSYSSDHLRPLFFRSSLPCYVFNFMCRRRVPGGEITFMEVKLKFYSFGLFGGKSEE